MERNNLSRALLALLSLSLSACSFGIDLTPKEQTFYTIAERTDEKIQSKATHGLQANIDLAVRETTATPFLSGRKIIFGENTQTRGFYQFASWVEPIPKRFAAILRETLRKSGDFRSVSRASLSAHGDLELVTELVECYHLISNPPGTVFVVIEADLIQPLSGNVLAHQRFEKQIQSPTFDAEGSVKATQEAFYDIIDQISAWAKATADGLPKK